VRRQKRYNFLVYLVLLAFFMTSMPFPYLGSRAEAAEPLKKFSTAIVSVEDATGIRGMGQEAKKALFSAFDKSPYFTILDQADVEDAIKELGLKPPLTFERAGEVGKKLNLDTVLLAKVMKYEKLPDPLRVKIEIIVNLLDVRSGIVCAKSQLLAYSSTEDVAKPTDEYDRGGSFHQGQ